MRPFPIFFLALTTVFLTRSMVTIAGHHDGIIAGATFVISGNAVPAALKKTGADQFLLLYAGTMMDQENHQQDFMKGDTITDLNKFLKLFKNSVTGYRCVFGKNDIDSTWDMTVQNQLKQKAYPAGPGFIRIVKFDAVSGAMDEFFFSYQQKYKTAKVESPSFTLNRMIRSYEFASAQDRSSFAAGKVWILSIGIDDYGETRFRTCASDARSYADFFRKQYGQLIGTPSAENLVHEYTLIDRQATRDSILGALKDISSQAKEKDIFIFNFSGYSSIKGGRDSSQTYFFPYDVTGKTNGGNNHPAMRNGDTKADPYDHCISLSLLQHYIQLIPSVNQLFISEAGPSERFKTEFVKTLMSNSPELASILNKNRVIIVPNGFGYENVSCGNERIDKGPINYYITSLKKQNVYNFFGPEPIANKVAFELKSKAYRCESFQFDYFDVFFERKFIREYNELNSGNSSPTRGAGTSSTELKTAANLDGKRYALVIGTRNYQGGWAELPNAIADAKAVAAELNHDYGFNVQLLEDQPMDTIYAAIGEYYRIMKPEDQLIIYFSGHGDEETEFLGDGFIVCHDSRPRAKDPARNTYIPHAKLQKMVNNIAARQILVVLDVCHGGLFNQKMQAVKRSDPGTVLQNRNVEQFLVTQSQYRCRRFLASVGGGEAFDGKPGELSPFANLFLQVLKARGEMTNGIVTLSNIFAVLQNASMNKERGADMLISPTSDEFGSNNPMSEFILIPVDKPDPSM